MNANVYCMTYGRTVQFENALAVVIFFEELYLPCATSRQNKRGFYLWLISLFRGGVEDGEQRVDALRRELRLDCA